MNRYSTKEILLVLTILITAYFSGGLIWLIPVTLWLVIFTFTERNQTRIKILGFGYPLIETIIKIIINFNLIPYSWNILNRVEHFFFSICLTFLFWYLLRFNHKQELPKYQKWLLLIGMVVIVGNINEFWEYLLRVITGSTSMAKFSVYYWDTIYDLFFNFLAAIVASTFLLFRFSSPQPSSDNNS